MQSFDKRSGLLFIVAFGVVSLFADMAYEGMRSSTGPFLALLGASGTAVVAFSVGASGGIRSVRLARSSGSSILDRAAVETVRRANPVPPAPAGVPGGSFTVPIRFSVGG